MGVTLRAHHWRTRGSTIATTRRYPTGSSLSCSTILTPLRRIGLGRESLWSRFLMQFLIQSTTRMGGANQVKRRVEQMHTRKAVITGTYALQSNSSSGPRRHNGVVTLPQCVHCGLGPTAASAPSAGGPDPGNCVACGFRFFLLNDAA